MADEQLTEEQIAANEAGDAEAAEKAEKKGPTGWIPKQRLDEVLGTVRELKGSLDQEREARIRLEEQVKAGQKNEPARYTKQSLREAVAVGQMTQDQADDLWDTQREAEITEKVMGAVTASTTQNKAVERVDTDLARYKALAPDLMVEGSEIRNEVTARYQYLISIGAPHGSGTQLAAANAVLGPIDRLEKKGKGRTVTQTHEETGGNDGGEKGVKKTLLDQAPPRYKQHYENLIAKGLTTPEQAEKELARAGIKNLEARAKRHA